jgi:cell division protease FtsH
MGRNLRNVSLWIIIFIAFIMMVKMMTQSKRVEKKDITAVLKLGKAGRILDKVVDRGGLLTGKYRADNGDEQLFETMYVGTPKDWGLADWALANNIAIEANPRSEIVGNLLIQVLLPIAILVVLWIFLMRQFQSGSNKAMSFGKSRAKLVTEGQVKVSFDDVAGIDEVKEELMEIIQFLKDPEKFSRLGGKIPKGALLYGPPGTGKTLIARAVAGEANVPFFSISGSDFVEMFVGVGASRVRDLFEQGKKAKPCLIYIDEIDAVGRHRFTGIGGGHDEREQTLNQLLVELDGFATNEGVIVMASTNRPDVLDPALLRPGRFDRQIRVDLPDLLGREKILAVHTKPLKMAKNVSLKQIAKGTPGFSGADLANLCNEAALLAARTNKETVGISDLEEAKDRVMMGPERRSLAMSEKERENTAYHEAGHALVAKMQPDHDSKVHKVTIIPRGRTLGVTALLPEEETHNRSRKQLLCYLVHMMGGRAAEEVKFADFTTGAANDLQRATELAHRMVCDFGMSEKLGPRTFGEPTAQVFLGKDITRERDFSEETASLIDGEVQGLLDNAYKHAKDILEKHRDILERVSEALLERETLDGEDMDRLIAGEALPPLFKDNHDRPSPPTPEETSRPERETAAAPVLRGPTVQPS